MTPIESIFEIKSAVLDLRRYLLSKDTVVSKKARMRYEEYILQRK
jgi:Mg2+ and Co2+ transporter CorA